MSNVAGVNGPDALSPFAIVTDKDIDRADNDPNHIFVRPDHPGVTLPHPRTTHGGGGRRHSRGAAPGGRHDAGAQRRAAPVPHPRQPPGDPDDPRHAQGRRSWGHGGQAVETEVCGGAQHSG
ncbi:hypothetical protein CHLRE_22g753797v5 [Chlamydomonas reinhardtii]|uniref:Uncharacterized protein n=1 Tax=Chlamydomonas reinhardtii TaxID=3055 RepID=A0A2K3CN84_CHLRE|nr:uncharacterized protein CHLRE_22g753797v5 [Chlamydomonas reinhardtii]PNW69733.1 hypothetical protein CHLRE_22g753797v5 [Chlamydomonas reinhardtii]